jgi:hypothetical protein
MLYLYAVAESLHDLAALTGVRHEALHLHPFAHATVVIGEIDAPPPLDATTLRAQDALVRALHDRAGALLPMRFGTTSASRDEMVRSLEAREGLLTRLAGVRGCEQMTVRVFGAAPEPDEPVASDARSGTEYLLARAKQQQSPLALEALATGVKNLTRDVRVEAATQPGVLGSVYHLIARGRSAEYRDAVQRAARDLTNVRVLVSGPSPAYAFA